MADPTIESVIEPGSQTDADVNPQAPDENIQGTEQRDTENRIPHSRVEEMISQRLEKARREWEEKDLNPLRKTQQDMVRQFQDAELARLKALGIYKDEQPAPLTRDEFDKQLKAMREEMRQAQIQQYHGQRITDSWSYAQQKYPKLLANKKDGERFGKLLMALYSEEPEVANPRDHVDYLAGLFNAANKAKQQERESPDRRIVPSGRGSAGPSANRNGEGKKQSVAEKIRARLRGQDED